MKSTRTESRRLGRCPFCRMRTRRRLFHVPMCEICADQIQDFIWVTLVQSLLVAVGAISGFYFVVDEILLFAVLVVIKHKTPPLLDRFVESS